MEFTGEATAVGRVVSLPPEATHTSGLAWDGESLWAVDYAADVLYELDATATLEHAVLSVRSRWPTGLRGSSALTVIEWSGKPWLALSDFRASCETLLVPLESLRSSPGEEVSKLARHTYSNRCFSQGLTTSNGLLIEALGAPGRDYLRVLRLPAAPGGGRTIAPEELMLLEAPGPAVEDLATDGVSLWTTDEVTFEVFKCRLPDSLRSEPPSPSVPVDKGRRGDPAPPNRTLQVPD